MKVLLNKIKFDLSGRKTVREWAVQLSTHITTGADAQSRSM